MGGKGSKAKKTTKEDEIEAKSSPSARKEDRPKTQEPAPAAKENGGTETGKEDEMHESWNDQTLFSSNNTKVTKDDFELLTVIGKGSFGKVNLFQ
jgi:hypothetical protein